MDLHSSDLEFGGENEKRGRRVDVTNLELNVVANIRQRRRPDSPPFCDGLE